MPHAGSIATYSFSLSNGDRDRHWVLRLSCHADKTLADRVADVAVTTPREAGRTVIEQRGALWDRLKQLETDLDNVYEEIQREHDHEQQLDQAVANVRATNGRKTALYKAVIAGLLGILIPFRSEK